MSPTPVAQRIERHSDAVEDGCSIRSRGTEKRRRFIWREPLGDPACPYVYRWVADFGRFGSIRLHQWLRSDEKRAKHDHPSDFLTLVLAGGYTDSSEHQFVAPPAFAEFNECAYGAEGGHACSRRPEHHPVVTSEPMRSGMIRRRRAEHTHTVLVAPGGCWTLLYFWPKRREWGFWHLNKRGHKFRWFNHRRWHSWMGQVPCED